MPKQRVSGNKPPLPIRRPQGQLYLLTVIRFVKDELVNRSLLSVTIIAGRIGNVHNDTDHEGESGNVEFSESCRTVGK